MASGLQPTTHGNIIIDISYHSKSIISMPKIIQLCDGIMASGLQPTTHGEITS